MISPSIVFLPFSIVDEFFLKVKFNKILLVIGISNKKPVKSVCVCHDDGKCQCDSEIKQIVFSLVKLFFIV